MKTTISAVSLTF